MHRTALHRRTQAVAPPARSTGPQLQAPRRLEILSTSLASLVPGLAFAAELLEALPGGDLLQESGALRRLLLCGGNVLACCSQNLYPICVFGREVLFQFSANSACQRGAP